MTAETEQTIARLDTLLDDSIAAVFALAEADALPLGDDTLPLYDVLRYHLGFLDADLRPERGDMGKRMRPKLCAYSCLAAGGALEQAVPVAAAIELLHNFTLVHDDIQDRSLLRRHRPTVWSRWGEAQAINAGDAMFVLAHLALNLLSDEQIDPSVIVRLSTALHHTTLRIVEGQVLDLSFEPRLDVTTTEYLRMISGKTVDIFQYATWAGAQVAGAGNDRATRFGDFGRALGTAFQLHDDILGIWGPSNATGKDAGDIARRKKTYPVVLLFERADADDRERLFSLYADDEIDAAGQANVLRLMDEYDIRHDAEDEVRRWHARARAALDVAQPVQPGRSLLEDVLRQLEVRTK